MAVVVVGAEGKVVSVRSGVAVGPEGSAVFGTITGVDEGDVVGRLQARTANIKTDIEMMSLRDMNFSSKPGF
jgi:hypothetical protein